MRSPDPQDSLPMDSCDCCQCPTCVQNREASPPPLIQGRSSDTPSVDGFFYDAVDNPSSPPTSSGNRMYDYFYGDSPTPDSSQSNRVETGNSQTVFTYM